LDRPHRNTIFVEDAQVLAQDEFEGAQRVLRLHAPRTAKIAQPGSFIHMRCDEALPLRRPMSIMRSDPEAGWIECLYKIVGHGTRLMASRKPGDVLNLMGPIGVPFRVHEERPLALMLGGGVGLPPMVFLAERLRHSAARPFVIMGSEVPFPFKSRPSAMLVPGMPDGVIACMPLMEDWGIPSRLASLQGYPGCFEGFITDLARHWLNTLGPDVLARCEIFACGPTPMLKACASLAAEFALPSQLSLEEFMACAVGGCAGCTVRVNTPQGPAMKRVCVDGPVFDGASIVWE
jgi:dihydroorotate dehydrogenase electron transfer subunit